jgi:tetratricopeptide (TPR) repeat protein
VLRRAPRPALGALFAAAAAFLAFLPSLRSVWLNWDDWVMVTTNPYIRSFSWENLRWDFTASPTGAYQPVAFLSYTFDYALWGLDPRGYHLTNALLHALCAALVFLGARRLMARASPRAAGEPEGALDAAALFAALVFALHPLRVESVSWISERRDVLCGALWLGALLAYLRERESRAPAARPSLPVLLLFVLACLTKGIAVTLPAVLLVLDVWPLRRRFSEAVAEKIPMFIAGGALGALAISRQAGARAAWKWSDHGLAARLAQAAYALVFYARKTVWPTGLLPFYEMRPPIHPQEPRFLACALVTAAVAALLWRVRKTQPAWAAAGTIYAVVLMPVSGLLQAGSQLVADRYSYLAALPFAALAGAGLRAALRRPAARPYASAGAALIVAALAAGTVAQQSYWRDSAALWGRVLAFDPTSPTALLNMGADSANAGRTADAAGYFERALIAEPGCIEAEGDPVKLWTHPVCRRALNNLGAARGRLGDYVEARRLLRLAVKADPDDVSARSNLARAEAALAGRRVSAP